jgi:CRP/FNR family cyclic AMP-dependent transcriptional regulator
VTVERISITSVLEKSQLFAGLSPAELQSLAARLVRKSYAAGQLLFSEGDECAGLFIIASGRIRIFKTSASGREQVLAVNSTGETLAELPVFDGGDYPASAVAVDDAEILFVSRREFQAFCLEHPQVALKVLSFVGARLRALVGIIEELSFTTIRERLIALLLKVAEKEGRPSARGLEFQLPASHQEIAHQLGTVRELISRNLARLQAEGLLEVEARLIVIKDKNALAAQLEAAK